MDKLENIKIENLVAGFEISNDLNRYLLLVDFIRQAGSVFYTHRAKGIEPAKEDIEIFTNKFHELKEFVDNICILPTTKV